MKTIKDFNKVLESAISSPSTEGEYELTIPYSISITRQWTKNFWSKSFSSNIVFIFAVCIFMPSLQNRLFAATKGLAAYEQWALYIMFSVCIGLFFAIIMLVLKGPRLIQIGQLGIRIPHIIFPGNSIWIPWNIVQEIRLINKGKSKQCIEIIIDNQSLRDLMGAGYFWSFCSSGLLLQRKRDGTKLIINCNAIVHEPDRAKFLEIAKHFVPSALDSSMYALELLTHTKLWLREFAQTEPPLNLLDQLPEGTELADGRFCILERVGAGGHSLTYKAAMKNVRESDDEQTSKSQATGCAEPNRIVVLKEFVLPIRAGREVRNRSLRHIENEISLLQKLDHPQIVKYVDSFVSRDRAYIASEFIQGKTLRQLLDSGNILSESEIIKIAKSMCSILKYLHALDPPVIHRDFTPENLLLQDDGTLILIDFNVAQQQESESTKTVVGKHHYLPPEQFRGKAVPQSDIYACGGCIFWLCTGQDPEPLSISHTKYVRKDISAELDAVVAKATALLLDERYATIQELENALP